MRIIMTFIALFISGMASAGLVEPCAKWDHLPVRVCKGTELIKNQYFSKVAPRPTKKMKRPPSREMFRDKPLVQSNTFYPNPTGLWDFAKNEISKEFTKESTGISFEFIESEDISQCDSILFFVEDSEVNFSSIGDRTDDLKNRRRIVTDKNQKVPSITVLGGLDPLIEDKTTSDFDRKKAAFEFKFRAYLSHEIGHLSGLRHTHAYKPLNLWKEKKGSSAIDICGLDQTSIMDYEVMFQSHNVYEILKKLSIEDHGPVRFATPGSCLNGQDQKILRCLYGAGTAKDECPEIKCKYKKE